LIDKFLIIVINLKYKKFRWLVHCKKRVESGMKPREAGTFEASLMELMDILGVERCATVVDRSTSLVRKWSDPDNNILPSLQQALALDLEYVRETNSAPPLIHAYTNAVELQLEAAEEVQKILPALLALQTAFNLLVQKVASDCVDLQRAKVERQELSKAERQVHWQNVLKQTDMVMRETRNLLIVISFWQRKSDRA